MRNLQNMQFFIAFMRFYLYNNTLFVRWPLPYESSDFWFNSAA